MSNPHNGRQARLEIDFTELSNLEGRSQFIKIEPQDVQPGWAPEKYLVTFSCKGIARVSDDGRPVESNVHRVRLYFPREYPGREPSLLWLTDIWHPNIDRLEPRHVCTNAVQTFFAQKPIADLVLSLGEMVQYKRYHAKLEQPFPQDFEVAKWVREVAEPKGWVGPDKPFDQRPLLREFKIRRGEDAAEVTSWTAPGALTVQVDEPPPPVEKPRIKFGAAKGLPVDPNAEVPPIRRIAFGKPKQSK